jgi:hypothetical protein
MSFDALSQIEKHEAAELLYLKKAKEQRKAANLLRKQYKVKQEAEVVSEESAVPEVVIAQPVAAESPLQVQSEFKDLPMQAPGAPVKKARKPLTQEHKAAMQAGRQKKKAEKAAAAVAAQGQPVARALEFAEPVAAPVVAPAPQNEMVVGSTVNNSKVFKLKGNPEERTTIIANLLPERLTKGKPINWRVGTKHHPLSKWPAAILEQLEHAGSTKDAICAMIQLNQKAFDDYIRELKHQNLVE